MMLLLAAAVVVSLVMVMRALFGGMDLRADLPPYLGPDLSPHDLTGPRDPRLSSGRRG